MKKRIEWIDVTKAICMLLIMVTHLECRSNTLLAYYQPIYVAGFFMCSGYCYSNKYSFKELIKNKAKTLLLPWFIYSNLNIIISQIGSIKEHNGLFDELFHNLLQIRYFDDRLWFLTSLFVTFIPFYWIIKSVEKNKNYSKMALFITVLFFIKKAYSFFVPSIVLWSSNRLPWHIDYIPTALFSMYLGYYYKTSVEKNAKILVWQKLGIILSYIIVCSLSFFIDIWANYFIYSFYDFVTQVLGLMTLIIIGKTIRENQYLRFVGENTLLYFCLHNKFLTVTEYAFKRFVPSVYGLLMAYEITQIMISFILAFAVSIILIIPIKIINKYFSFTLGKF